MDQQIYSTMLQAAHQILTNNGQQLGREFCEGFMFDHDPANGQGSVQNAEQMFRIVADEAQRLNGQRTIRDDRQLFEIVGAYVQNVFDRYRQSRTGSGFNNSGSFGGSAFGRPQQPQSFFGGNRPMFSQGSGFGNFNQPRPTAGSHLTDDTIAQPTRPSPTATTPAALNLSSGQVPIKDTGVMASYSYNPTDDIPESGISFTTTARPRNWGVDLGQDQSIRIKDKVRLSDPEQKYNVNMCEGYALPYFSKQMDVAREFFRVAPDTFLAEHFIFRLFYNHVDEIDISTQSFIMIRDEFATRVRGQHTDIYKTIKSVLDNLAYAPRMAMANYLVQHINRALYLSCGMHANPSVRIKFSQIEDLEELLGTHFQHPFLLLPNGRERIREIVSVGIANALGGYSDAMFGNREDSDIEIIRSSPVFPFSIPGLYPSKDVIPPPGTDDAAKFLNELEKHLEQKTYVRSVRSIIFTNVLGQKILPQLGDLPILRVGQIPAFINQYILRHELSNIPGDGNLDEFNASIGEDNDDKSPYQKYLKNTEEYDARMSNSIGNIPMPKLPVDQMIFALQYKVSPNDFLMGLDILSTLDTPTGTSGCIFAKKKLDELNLVR